jgi:fumarate hydratase class II
MAGKRGTGATRTEGDSLGAVEVPADRYWGAQTERSRRNFTIGGERMPLEIVRALALVKLAAAQVNRAAGSLPAELAGAIEQAAQEAVEGRLDAEFPLVVWQTGSGTQSNMNANEVIAGRANEILTGRRGGKAPVHPNDHVNQGQSSNDCFPTAMHIAAVEALAGRTRPALAALRASLAAKARAFARIVKVGRTHLMDATPLTLGQEVGGWAAQLGLVIAALDSALKPLHALAQGGTAVGTGLNSRAGFDRAFAAEVRRITGRPFRAAADKFAALAGHEPIHGASAALEQAAVALMKIGNDVRLLGSGPRAGLAELRLPENEPGSSIMPGKVNPTQAEALTMVAAQVMGNHAALTIGASLGHLQLNVFKPMIAANLLRSARLLADAADSFRVHCVEGLEPDRRRIAQLLERSLMLVTALNPAIGYDKAAKVAKLALAEDLSLKQAALRLGYLDAATFDRLVRPEAMLAPTPVKTGPAKSKPSKQ